MKLIKQDIQFLLGLYKMRCLNLQQSYLFFYYGYYQNIQDLYKLKLIPLIQNEFIKMNANKGTYYFEITQKAIDFIKEKFNIPTEIYDIQTSKITQGMLRANQIMIDPRLSAHQLELNQFVLEFQKKYYLKYKKNIQYFDEKYLSQMTNIRPDGLIRINDLDLFLEQDMKTENSKQLSDKWNRYRRFLTFEFDQEGPRKIIVCFIVKCDERDLPGRKELIRKTIANTFDTLLSNHFDIYIDSKEKIMEMLFNKILPGQKKFTQDLIKTMKKHNYNVQDGSTLKIKLDGSVYHYYIDKRDSRGHLGYYAPNRKRSGRFLEFLADEYKYSPVSVMSKIAFHERNSHNFDIAYSKKANVRLIGYIVIIDNIHEVFTHLKTMDLIGINNVYFTTMDRLNTMKLSRALFSFKENGFIYNCPNDYFEPTDFEGIITEYKDNGLKK